MDPSSRLFLPTRRRSPPSCFSRWCHTGISPLDRQTRLKTSPENTPATKRRKLWLPTIEYLHNIIASNYSLSTWNGHIQQENHQTISLYYFESTRYCICICDVVTFQVEKILQLHHNKFPLSSQGCKDPTSSSQDSGSRVTSQGDLESRELDVIFRKSQTHLERLRFRYHYRNKPFCRALTLAWRWWDGSHLPPWVTRL